MFLLCYNVFSYLNYSIMVHDFYNKCDLIALISIIQNSFTHSRNMLDKSTYNQNSIMYEICTLTLTFLTTKFLLENTFKISHIKKQIYSYIVINPHTFIYTSNG